MNILQFQMRKPDDFHVHLRENPILDYTVGFTARYFGRALVMPNLNTPITTGKEVLEYKNKINTLSAGTGFKPLMTVKLTKDTTVDTLFDAANAGAIAAKLYPEGVTTNSDNGISNISKLNDIFNIMEELEMVLCIHAEKSNMFSLDREVTFLPIIEDIIKAHRKLKVVIEHITDAKTVKFIAEHYNFNIAATITAHHLFLTLDDVIGDKIKPHNFCKPIAKRKEDRDVLINAAFSNNPMFFFGSDSAPHLIENKENANGCAGCFTAPIAIELLAELFDKHNKLDKLEAFMSQKGAEFYCLDLNKEIITLQKETWKIPDNYYRIIPFKAGEELKWKVL